MKAVKWIKYVFFFFCRNWVNVLSFFKNQSPKDLIAQLKDVNYFWVVLYVFGFVAIVSRDLDG